MDLDVAHRATDDNQAHNIIITVAILQNFYPDSVANEIILVLATLIIIMIDIDLVLQPVNHAYNIMCE